MVSSAASAVTRAAMSSRTRRIRSMPSMPRSDGSSVSQFSNWVPGDRVDVGFAAEGDHEVDARARSCGSIGFGVSPVMSTPTSARLRRTAR